MVRKYDLVFGLGAACACTECLRYAGLQYSSFPFDWLFGSSLERRTDILVDGHADWLRAEDLEHVFSVVAIKTDAYRNNATGITFNHDFPAGVPMADSIAKVREKYDRRFDRLQSLISRGGNVLAVYLTAPGGVVPAAGEAAYCRRRLSERFPGTAFDVLVMSHGENAEPKVEWLSEGVTLATFDYRSHADPTGANPVDRDRVIGFLKGRGYSARDYRSAAERRRHSVAEREKQYARFGATNALGYLAAKAKYKLYVHLKKKLERKGLV